ncbi:MAG: tRNA (N(6)-L-threonylcarbamoyladenosine(37)-C(2))-methylthiotransferase MtaB [Tenuifilaceae bacterium]|nr:tRNA (N(6)-L-threonylcarbamoyladenosine(37)-C(2))-methylthiotransferase MtaB [Tenuifilaceae bacterium]
MSNTRKRVAFFTLGCKLNFSETSTIARQFDEMGFERVSPSSPADVYVINTCSVTEHADKKCRQAIKKFVKQSPNAFVAVVGCYAQLKPEEIAQMDGVDLVMGASQKGNLPQYIGDITKNKQARVYSCDVDALNDIFPAYSSGDRTRSFLKVQDGCDYHCTYCTIPLARGKSRNLPIEKVIDQAIQIASEGIKEVILTGVNTGDFGRSTGEKFIDLLHALENVEGIERYRISSIEPNLITDDIVAFVATSSKFLPHFHIPLQSGSDNVLKLMKRRYNTSLFADKIVRIKQAIPNAFIGVDVIVGFPGETDEDFTITYQLLEGLKPSFLHVFPYSERPNTPAASYQSKVNPKIISTRAANLQALSHDLHLDFYRHNFGRIDEVLFESTRKDGMINGFTRNYIKVESQYSKNLAGHIIKVKLTELAPSGNCKVQIID